MINTIGFMQGRLCDPVDGKIQAFPWRDWETEFPAAASIDLRLMEWTLDQDRLYYNPLMMEEGREKIRELCCHHSISIASLTGDCFMQAPFWKFDGDTQVNLQRDFLAVCCACTKVGIHMLVVPLVDNGSLSSSKQENVLIEFLLEQQEFLSQQRLQVIFESDFSPNELARFIARLPVGQFGINYDIGNSAALGFSPLEEFDAYGDRVCNVHVKDRLLGGGTCPLGMGSADFDAVFSALASQKYRGNFILQAARAPRGNHLELLAVYRDIVYQWIRDYGLGATM